MLGRLKNLKTNLGSRRGAAAFNGIDRNWDPRGVGAAAVAGGAGPFQTTSSSRCVAHPSSGRSRPGGAHSARGRIETQTRTAGDPRAPGRRGRAARRGPDRTSVQRVRSPRWVPAGDAGSPESLRSTSGREPRHVGRARCGTGAAHRRPSRTTRPRQGRPRSPEPNGFQDEASERTTAEETSYGIHRRRQTSPPSRPIPPRADRSDPAASYLTEPQDQSAGHQRAPRVS